MIHHDRSYMDIYVIYHCGKVMIKGPVEIAEPNLSKPAGTEPHCKRCLYGKRKAKGDAYMLEHGYPLIKRERANGIYGWRLVEEVRTEELNAKE